jgi:hypothetical protein
MSEQADQFTPDHIPGVLFPVLYRVFVIAIVV